MDIEINKRSSKNVDVSVDGRSSAENESNSKCATSPLVYDGQTTEDLECPFCSKKFSRGNKTNLENHVRIHTGEKPHACKKCNRGFSRNVNLQRHMLSVHVHEHKNIIHGHSSTKKRSHIVKKSYNYQCDVCSRKCRTPSELQIHLKSHTGEKSFSCPVCNRGFARSDSLKIHELIHRGEKPFKCETCDQAFRCVSKLNSHKKLSHTGDNAKIPAQKILGVRRARSSGKKKSVECEVCSKKFAGPSKLQIHLRIHTGEKPYICAVCSRGFSEQCNLRKHELMHTGEKPFKCDECDLAYVNKNRLMAHKMRVHTGDRDKSKFRVKTAKKRKNFSGARKPKYERPRNFPIHTGEKHRRRTHTGEKRYECDECDQKFTQNSQLLGHKMDNHNRAGSSRMSARNCRRALNVGTSEKNSLSIRSDRPAEPSSSETRTPLIYPESISQGERARQWESFINVFNAKISKK